MNAHRKTGLVYDAAAVSRILGSIYLPYKGRWRGSAPANGEIVLYYGGWDLTTLRNIPVGETYMWQYQTWYDDEKWNVGPAKPGYYRLNLRIPDSNRKTWSEQVAHLRTIGDAWQPAPVTVAATALLVHLTETGNDLLQGGWCRCAEPIRDADHAILCVRGGRVGISGDWNGIRHDDLWLAAAQEC